MSVFSMNSSDMWIRIIAIFKLTKAALLIAVGFGILKLLHKDVSDLLMHWINVLRVDPDNRYAHALLTRSLGLDSRKLKEIGAGTFCYAGLFLTEGLGLLLRKHWAQYFTIIVTGSLLPLEFYEMAQRPGFGKIFVIAANIAVVVYLAQRVRQGD